MTRLVVAAVTAAMLVSLLAIAVLVGFGREVPEIFNYVATSAVAGLIGLLVPRDEDHTPKH